MFPFDDVIMKPDGLIWSSQSLDGSLGHSVLWYLHVTDVSRTPTKPGGRPGQTKLYIVTTDFFLTIKACKVERE